MAFTFLQNKRVRIILIGVVLIAALVAGLVVYGMLRPRQNSGYNRTCPVSGARCSSGQDALVAGCHG